MTDKWQHCRPLDIQPSASHIVTLGTYYATLKGHPEYKKHITWLVHSPHVDVYKYQGMPAITNKPCQWHQQTGEFVWTKPVVLDNVRQGLKCKHAQPREVYKELVVANQSDSRPLDRKHSRNQAQVTQVTMRPTTHGTESNVADEFVALLATLHWHLFVKVITIRHEQHPVVGYKEDQMKDINRFCSVNNTPAPLKTVLGIDCTFNLGSCCVTICVYRNTAVVCKTTQDHQTFLGQFIFHYDSRLDAYKEKCISYMTDVASVPVKHQEAVLECLRAVSSMR